MAANEGFVSLKDIEASPNAQIHGKLIHNSPMKKGIGASFFEAYLSDGQTQMKLVGFKRLQRELLSDFECSSEPVFLENCQVKKTRLSEELEVLLKLNTAVHKSP